MRDARRVVADLRGYEPFSGHLGERGRLEDVASGWRAVQVGHGWIRAGRLDATLPGNARQPLRLEVPSAESPVWIELRDPDARAVDAEVVEGAVVVRDAFEDVDLTYVAEPGRAEELRLLRTPAAPSRMRLQLTMAPGVSARLSDGRIEIVDSEGRVRFESEPMFALDADGKRRDLDVTLERAAGGVVIVATLDTEGLRYPIAVDPAWSTIADMKTGRAGFAGAVIDVSGSKRLMVMGGEFPLTNSVEVYNPTTNVWTSKTSFPGSARSGYSLTTLKATGKVLLASGINSDGSCLLYDPVADSWSATGSMANGHVDTPTTVLLDGRVLVAGGNSFPVSPLATSEAYDPTLGKWTTLAPIAVGRNYGALVTMTDGRVMLIGGYDATNATIATPEVWSPVTKIWSTTSPSILVRRSGAPFPIPGGKVLLVGGFGGTSGMALTDAAEVWDPAGGGTWTRTGPAVYAARSATYGAFLPLLGKVLIAGGGGTFGGGGELNTAEMFDPATATWSSAGVMSTGRNGYVPLLLDTGEYFAIGGGSRVKTTDEWVAGPVGATCVGSGECAGGHCSDGYCCTTTCTDQACHLCSLTGSEGTCTAVDGISDPHAKCKVGACSNPACAAGACSYKPVTALAPCSGVDVCSGSTFTPGDHCSGVDEKCVVGTSAPCAFGLKCASSSKCKTACALDADCATPPCDVASGKCGVVADAGADVGTDADASSDSADADAGSDAGAEVDTGAGDSLSADTGVIADTDVADTAVVDTAMDDSAAADTAIADSALADTAVADTGVSTDGGDVGAGFDKPGCGCEVPATSASGTRGFGSAIGLALLAANVRRRRRAANAR